MNTLQGMSTAVQHQQEFPGNIDSPSAQKSAVNSFGRCISDGYSEIIMWKRQMTEAHDIW